MSKYFHEGGGRTRLWEKCLHGTEYGNSCSWRDAFCVLASRPWARHWPHHPSWGDTKIVCGPLTLTSLFAFLPLLCLKKGLPVILLFHTRVFTITTFQERKVGASPCMSWKTWKMIDKFSSHGKHMRNERKNSKSSALPLAGSASHVTLPTNQIVFSFGTVLLLSVFIWLCC